MHWSMTLAPRFGPDSLRYSLLVFGALGVWVAWHFWQGGKHLERDLGRADAPA